MEMTKLQKLELHDKVFHIEQTICHLLAQPGLLPRYPSIAHIYHEIYDLYKEYCGYGIPLRHYYRGDYLKQLLNDCDNQRISYYTGSASRVAYYRFDLNPNQDYIYGDNFAKVVKWPHKEKYPRGARENGEILVDGCYAYSVKLAVEYALRNSLEFWRDECRYIKSTIFKTL